MTKQPKTVDAMDRETERLRAEKRGVLAALHACSGRDGESPGTLLESLDALDRALERLAERRPRAVAALRDPEASERRRERRAVALGRWLETRALTLGQMRRVEALAGEAGCGLFAEEVLAADGWRRDAHGHWHGPLSPGAATRGRSATSWCSRRREPMSREISSLRSNRSSRAATLSRSTSPTRRRSSRPRISATRSARHGTTQTPRPSSAASTPRSCRRTPRRAAATGRASPPAGASSTPGRSSSRRGRARSSPSGWRRRARRWRPRSARRSRRPPTPARSRGSERPVEETPPADALRAVRTSSGAAAPFNSSTQEKPRDDTFSAASP